MKPSDPVAADTDDAFRRDELDLVEIANARATLRGALETLAPALDRVSQIQTNLWSALGLSVGYLQERVDIPSDEAAAIVYRSWLMLYADPNGYLAPCVRALLHLVTTLEETRCGYKSYEYTCLVAENLAMRKALNVPDGELYPHKGEACGLTEVHTVEPWSKAARQREETSIVTELPMDYADPRRR